MTTMRMQGSFVENLPKIYGLYTGGFIVFIGLMAILEQMGVSADTIGILFVGFTVLIYAAIGWLSRTMQVDAYYVAGRSVPPVFNGMATAADWMSGASFVAMAGGIYMGGHAYPRVRRRLDRRVRAGGGAHGAVPAQIRLLHRARLHRHALRRQHCALLRGARPGHRVVHLRDGADQRDRHHRVAGPAHSIRGRGLVRPARHPALFDARRHAGGDVDPGGAVHRAHHRLPRPGDLDVEQAGLRRLPAARLRRGGDAARRAGADAPSRHPDTGAGGAGAEGAHGAARGGRDDRDRQLAVHHADACA